MGEIGRFATYNIRRLLTSPRLYIALLITSCCIWMSFGNVSFVLAEEGKVLQATELFSFSFSNRIPQWFFTLGILLLLVDIPFLHEGLSIRLVRSTRFRWFVGQILFSLITIIFYILFIQVLLMVIVSNTLSFSNSWSDTIQIAARLPSSAAIKQLGVSIAMDFPLNIVLNSTPLTTFIITLIYNSLLFFVFSLICLIFNVKYRTGAGCFVIVSLLMLRYLIDNSMLPLSKYLILISPCNLAAPQVKGVGFSSFLYVVVFFLAIIGLLLYIGYYIIQHADIDSGDRT